MRNKRRQQQRQWSGRQEIVVVAKSMQQLYPLRKVASLRHNSRGILRAPKIIPQRDWLMGRKSKNWSAKKKMAKKITQHQIETQRDIIIVWNNNVWDGQERGVGEEVLRYPQPHSCKHLRRCSGRPYPLPRYGLTPAGQGARCRGPYLVLTPRSLPPSRPSSCLV